MTSTDAPIATNGPYTGLTVLNLSTGIAGTMAGHLLAANGARVILVEPPPGSPLRRLGPFPDDVPDGDASALFLHLARGQQSLTLDRATATGQRLLVAIARTASLIIEDEGAADPHGVRALLQQQRRDRPCSIVSISPFGLSGPWANRPASDIVLLALSGLLAAGGDPAREPLQPPDWLIQEFVGISTFTAAAAAIVWQEASDRPHDVDVAMLDVLAAAHENAVSRFTYAGHRHKREGNRLETAYPWTLLPCQDGHIGIIALPRNWDVLCHWMERPDLIDDPRFATPHARSHHADALDAILTEWTMRHTKQDLYREGQERHLPFGAAVTFDDVLQDEHVRAREALQCWQHPRLGALLAPAVPGIVNGIRPRISPAPRLGDQTATLLAGCAVLSDRAELTRLRQEGVL